MDAISTTQVIWQQNGDHPDDCSEMITDGDGRPMLTEGRVVRRYRHPSLSGVNNCIKCQHTFDRHGWVDDGNGGQVVCPGDTVISTDTNHYVVVPQQLMRTLDQQSLTFYLTPKT